MNIYQHIAYNPQTTGIRVIINIAQKESKEWRFCSSQPITDYEWVAIFEKELPEISGVETPKVVDY